MTDNKYMQGVLHAFGALVCGMKKHHIYGHKFKLTYSHAASAGCNYAYQCSRCGRIKEAPLPVKRVKK